LLAYVNGVCVPEEEATISIFDRGLLFGDGVFDMTRTFQSRIFKLDEHLNRLAKSLRYLEFDDGRIIPQVRVAVNEVVSRNHEAICALGDTWINTIVTRGVIAESDFLSAAGPTVIVMVRRIAFHSFAHLYERGVDLGVSIMTRHPAGSLDPRAKTINRLGFIRGELKMIREGTDGGRWTLAFNNDGSVAETTGANLCIIEGGRLVRPPRHQALEGISLQTLCDLALQLGMPVDERPLTTYDIVNADETVITSTSFSLLPVAKLDGINLRRGDKYQALLHAWIKLVGLNFVEQAQQQAAKRNEGAIRSSG
jgi:branched-chain amino acid aminotransferase